MSDIPGSAAFMDTMVTATSLYLFESFSGDGFEQMEARESVFSNAENLNIDADEQDFFGKLKFRGAKVDPQALMKMS